MLWTRGPRDDYDEWARRVNSEKFSWEEVSKVFRRIEALKDPGYGDVRREFVDVDVEVGEHGNRGPVSVEFPARWEEGTVELMQGVREFGWGVNRNLNSGDPIGVGICSATSKGGRRVTAKTAYLSDGPRNLEIRAGVQVGRAVIEGRRAVGVESVEGERYFARKEVILSAGALDTPKILLLSGIGPAEELAALDIPVVKDLPGVGRNLQDHCHFPISAVVEDSTRESNNLKPGSEELKLARSQFLETGTGPFSYINGSYIMGFLKDESLYSSTEFKALDIETQYHLFKPTVPTWEFSTGLPVLGPPRPGPPRTYLNSIAVLMNPQSRGVVKLQSADLTVPALFDPKLMSHPYDEKALITAAKSVLAFLKTPSIAATITAPANMPASESEADVVAFVKENLKSTWHMSGTCKMGVEGDETAVVDEEFRVKGCEGLRVVDLSVLPFLINAHPIAVAYVVGEIATEGLGREYSREE